MARVRRLASGPAWFVSAVLLLLLGGERPWRAMYRRHVMDPVRFERDLRVTIQALRWRGDGRYLPTQPERSSVAYSYQTLPTAPFPRLPGRDEPEIN